MRRCNVCGNTTFHEDNVKDVFEVNGRMVMVENIPALVCDRCGEANFDRETAESVRQAAQRSEGPSRRITLDVFALH